MASYGYCKDYAYLPEGGYHSLLNKSDPPYDKDRIKECMNRCVYALNKEEDTKIRDRAFYIRDCNQRCACSSAACYSRKSSGYSSYHTIPGNSKKVYVLVYFQNITCKCQLISNNFQIINFRMESGRRKTRIWGYRN